MTAAEPAAGRRFERRCLRVLHDNGYWAMRTPGSRTLVDLVALKPGQTLFIQCKVNGRLDPEPWNGLITLARTYGALPVLAARDAALRIEWWELLTRKPHRGPAIVRRQLVIDEAASHAI